MTRWNAEKKKMAVFGETYDIRIIQALKRGGGSFAGILRKRKEKTKKFAAFFYYFFPQRVGPSPNLIFVIFFGIISLKKSPSYDCAMIRKR